MASFMQKLGLSRGKVVGYTIAVIIFAFFAIMAAMGGIDTVFSGKSYEIPHDTINAEVETDGSLHVNEQRTFTFHGDYSAVWWVFDNLPTNAVVEINSVRVAQANENGDVEGSWETLSETPFVVSWRDSGGPDEDAYSYDVGEDSLYVFFNASDATRVVEIDYTIVNGVKAYEDVGELYWQYVGQDWDVSTNNVTCNISIPVPDGTEVTAGDNIRAWGHGPTNGTVSIGDDGVVHYTASSVSAGQFAEARIVFPTEWLTDIDTDAQSAYQSEMRLSDVLSEEKSWSDQASRDQMLAYLVTLGFAILSLALVIWGLVSFFRYGKDYVPTFKDKYWRDVPDKNIHPAVIGRLWRWNQESNNDFTATLMHLSVLGALRIDKGTYENEKGKQVEDYYITRIPAVKVTDPLDEKALSILFDQIGNGEMSIWVGSIKRYGEANPGPFMREMNAWQGLLSAQAGKEDFFEAKGDRYHTWLMIAMVALLALSIGVCLWVNNFLSMIFVSPASLVLGFLAHYMPRRSQRATDLIARCKALRNWLEDFSSLDERPPTDVKVWGEFMVYAYLFGVAKKVMRQLRNVIPEVMDEENINFGTSYIPWYYWYGATTVGGAHIDPGADMFQTALDNTIQTAESFIQTNAGSGGGDVFGGGGNFFDGGGFGIGGGGGAR